MKSPQHHWQIKPRSPICSPRQWRQLVKQTIDLISPSPQLSINQRPHAISPGQERTFHIRQTVPVNNCTSSYTKFGCRESTECLQQCDRLNKKQLPREFKNRCARISVWAPASEQTIGLIPCSHTVHCFHEEGFSCVVTDRWSSNWWPLRTFPHTQCRLWCEFIMH